MNIFGPLLVLSLAILLPLAIFGIYKLVIKIKQDKFTKELILNDSDLITETIKNYNNGKNNRNHYLDLCEDINKIMRNTANKRLAKNPPRIRIIFGGYSYTKIKNDLAIECVMNCAKSMGYKHEGFKDYLIDISNRINIETEDLYCQTIILERPEHD